MITKEDLNKEQREAFELLTSGQNVFLTGDAGTGKTTVMKLFIEEMESQGKSVLVTATTGVAATNLGEGALTVHRALGIKTDMTTYTKKVKTRPQYLKAADVLIIDEISMCRFDLFNMIFKTIELENKQRERDRMIGEADMDPLQVVISGDFFQLPPVINKDDRAALPRMYGDDYLPEGKNASAYAFYSKHWKDMMFIPVNLAESCRQQGDPEFIKVINDVKYGANIRSSINYLEDHSAQSPFDAPFLVGRNAEADDINTRRLNKLNPETEFVSVAKIEGEDITENDVKNLKLPSEITLNIGAKVMCTVNNPENGYVNGTIGTITDVAHEDDFTKMYVTIRTRNGDLIRVVPSKQDIVKQVVKDIEDTMLKEISKEDAEKRDSSEVIVKKAKGADEETKYYIEETFIRSEIIRKKVGIITQMPLKLAWAFSVHKSQGQTFEAVNIDPKFWEVGQFYVAISRAKSINGIYFMSPIKQRAIRAFSKADQKRLAESCGVYESIS